MKRQTHCVAYQSSILAHDCIPTSHFSLALVSWRVMSWFRRQGHLVVVMVSRTEQTEAVFCRGLSHTHWWGPPIHALWSFQLSKWGLETGTLSTARGPWSRPLFKLSWWLIIGDIVPGCVVFQVRLLFLHYRSAVVKRLQLKWLGSESGVISQSRPTRILEKLLWNFRDFKHFLELSTCTENISQISRYVVGTLSGQDGGVFGPSASVWSLHASSVVEHILSS